MLLEKTTFVKTVDFVVGKFEAHKKFVRTYCTIAQKPAADNCLTQKMAIDASSSWPKNHKAFLASGKAGTLRGNFACVAGACAPAGAVLA